MKSSPEENDLTSENLFHEIQRLSILILNLDREIIGKSEWWEMSNYTVNDFEILKDYLLFERQILCLAGAMVGILGEKNAQQICLDTIRKIAKSNYELVNAIVTESQRTPTFFFEFVSERLDFYLDELLLCYELKNPWSGRILYYLFNPMEDIITPKIDIEYPQNSKGVIIDVFLDMRFRSTTLPILVNHFPKYFNIKK